jgi:hypothetical protein
MGAAFFILFLFECSSAHLRDGAGLSSQFWMDTICTQRGAVARLANSLNGWAGVGYPIGFYLRA